MRNFLTLMTLVGFSQFFWQFAIYWGFEGVPRPRRVMTVLQTRVEPYVRQGGRGGGQLGGCYPQAVVSRKKSRLGVPIVSVGAGIRRLGTSFVG